MAGTSGPTGPSTGQPERRNRGIIAGFAVGLVLVVGAVYLGTRGSSETSASSDATATPTASQSPLPGPPVCRNLSPAMLTMRHTREEPYPMTIDPHATYIADVHTSCGTLRLRLPAAQAPAAVNNFVNLAQDDYFTGQNFFRIDPELGIIQAGDAGCPQTGSACGTDGPGYTLPADLSSGMQPRLGSVAMAPDGGKSSGSQFVIAAGPEGESNIPAKAVFAELVGAHSKQVARTILSVPTKVPPWETEAGPGIAADYPDGEYVYIERIKITKE